jgi:cell division protein FtsA
MLSALDLGSSKIKIIVAKEENLELMYKGEIESEGIRRGVVIDSEKVSSILISLFKRIKEETKEKIFEVLTCFNGSHLFSFPSRASISVSRADRKISKEDVERLLQTAQEINLSGNKKAFDFAIKKFIIDGETEIDDPVDLEGLKLEVEIISFCGFSPYLENHKKAILKSGIEILDVLPAPLASAEAVLTERDKERGVAVIDIGASTTSFSVFEEQNLLHFSVLPVGSMNITNDIAVAFKINLDLAEKIKKEFGIFSQKGKESHLKIEEEGKTFLIPQKALSKVIKERMGEIFSQINQKLKEMGIEKKLPAGIVLTGGGAKLAKIKDLAKEKFSLPVRLGRILNCPDLERELEYSACWGLILYAQKGREKKEKILDSKILNKIKRFFRIFIP